MCTGTYYFKYTGTFCVRILNTDFTKLCTSKVHQKSQIFIMKKYTGKLRDINKTYR